MNWESTACHLSPTTSDSPSAAEQGVSDIGEERSAPDSGAPGVLTVAEVAELLRVRQNHIYGLAKKGEIPGLIELGRSIRFSEKAIQRWIDSGDASKPETKRSKKRGRRT